MQVLRNDRFPVAECSGRALSGPTVLRNESLPLHSATFVNRRTAKVAIHWRGIVALLLSFLIYPLGIRKKRAPDKERRKPSATPQQMGAWVLWRPQNTYAGRQRLVCKPPGFGLIVAFVLPFFICVYV